MSIQSTVKAAWRYASTLFGNKKRSALPATRNAYYPLLYLTGTETGVSPPSYQDKK